MPRVRGLVVALACAVGAVLGLSGANLASATLAACGAAPGERVETARVGVRLSGVLCEQRERAPVPARAAPADTTAPVGAAGSTEVADRAGVTGPAGVAGPADAVDAARVAGPVSAAAPGLAAPGLAAPELAGPERAAPERAGPERAGPELAAPGAPFVAIATRHAPTSTKDLPPGVENPVTDRALALLVGWTMLALIGGGLFAGRRPSVRRRQG